MEPGQHAIECAETTATDAASTFKDKATPADDVKPKPGLQGHRPTRRPKTRMVVQEAN